jgi:hypothetical protein
VTRRNWLALAAVLAIAVTGCSGGHSSPAAPNSPSAVSLPDVPPPDVGCQGDITARQDISHPKLGTVRLFLLLNPSMKADSRGCVVAVAGTGKAVTAIPLDIGGNSLAFANPLTDATGNAFITYNPGRYDGVLVLVPTATGFQDPGWAKPDIHYAGKRAYYDAKPQGPGPDGRYTILQSRNDCVPSCASGTVRSMVLHWDGNDYVP